MHIIGAGIVELLAVDKIDQHGSNFTCHKKDSFTLFFERQIKKKLSYQISCVSERRDSAQRKYLKTG